MDITEQNKYETELEAARKRGPEALESFVKEVKEARFDCYRQMRHLYDEARARAVQYGQPIESELWTEHAKQRLDEKESRLCELESMAVKELETNFDHN